MTIEEVFDYQRRLNELLAVAGYVGKLKVRISYQHGDDYYRVDSRTCSSIDEIFSFIQELVDMPEVFDYYKQVMLPSNSYFIANDDIVSMFHFGDPTTGTLFSFSMCLEIERWY